MITLAAGTRKGGTTDTTDHRHINAPQAAHDTIAIITHPRRKIAVTAAANVTRGIHTRERTAPAQISVHIQGQEKAVAAVVGHLTVTITRAAAGQGMDTGTADTDRRETVAGTVDEANQKNTQVGGI